MCGTRMHKSNTQNQDNHHQRSVLCPQSLGFKFRSVRLQSYCPPRSLIKGMLKIMLKLFCYLGTSLPFLLLGPLRYFSAVKWNSVYPLCPGSQLPAVLLSQSPPIFVSLGASACRARMLVGVSGRIGAGWLLGTSPHMPWAGKPCEEKGRAWPPHSALQPNLSSQ